MNSPIDRYYFKFSLLYLVLYFVLVILESYILYLCVAPSLKPAEYCEANHMYVCMYIVLFNWNSGNSDLKETMNIECICFGDV